MSFFEQISLTNNFNASLNTNMWQVYTRPISASDFFILSVMSQFCFRIQHWFYKVNVEFSVLSFYHHNSRLASLTPGRPHFEPDKKLFFYEVLLKNSLSYGKKNLFLAILKILVSVFEFDQFLPELNEIM
jgi:hypothetical protein